MEKSFVAGLKPGHIFRDEEAKKRVVGWTMKPEEVAAFFQSQNKKVVTFVGYSSEYEDKNAMLAIVKATLAKYSPDSHLVNIGVTVGGIGAAYPLAKSMGFMTTGIVSTLAVQFADEISTDVDKICFVDDKGWGGILEDDKTLSPTSRAMVHCSDIVVGIGGGEISRDELLEAKRLGKLVAYHPAEVSHDWAIQRAHRAKEEPPATFWGAAHSALMGKSNK